MLILDIETYKSDNENYLRYKTGKIKPEYIDANSIQPPSNYKDPNKIADYIANKKNEALIKNAQAEYDCLLKIKEEEKKFSLSPLTGRVILVGLMTDSTDIANSLSAKPYASTGFFYRNIGLDGNNERQVIEETMNLVGQIFKDTNTYETLVTYNGKRFDLPFLIYRAMIYNIKKPFSLPSYSELTNVYNNTYHVDLFDSNVKGSLTDWSFICGDSNELGVNGGQIWNMFENKEYQNIINKNIMDCFQVGLIYNRMKDWYGKY